MWVRILVVSVLILMLDSIGRTKAVRRGLEWVLSPVSTGVGRVQLSARTVSRRVKFVKSGAVRLVDLERQVAELSTTVGRVNELEKENRILRGQLGILDVSYQYRVGEVVSIAENTMIMTVEGGGVSLGAPVLWEDGLIGMVERVGGWTVRVRLIGGLGKEVPVNLVDGSGRDIGEALLGSDIAHGLVVSQVLQEVGLNVGDVVVTRGSDGIVPAGLVIGIIREVVGSDADVYNQAIVEPIYRPDYGDLVFVVGGSL